jgi:nicotinate phosphoribosyltransferase
MLSLLAFHPGLKRFVNPHRSPAGLEKSLNDMRLDLITRVRAKQPL